jgi:nucleotide-binding universal stress UspA family protein
MHSLSRILLPVDFSERSACAARYARALGSQFDSEIILLHVLAPPQYEFGSLEAAGTMLSDLYQNRAAQVARDLESLEKAELSGARVRRIILEGDPAPVIVRHAQQEAAGLIVMPTHGFGPFRRFILGSNTAKVLHDADCPVWTGIHLDAAPRDCPLRCDHVLCAVDLGAQSSKTLCWAAMLAGRFGAKLTLLHAVAGVPNEPDASQQQWQAGIREAARVELNRLREFVNAEAEVLVRAGDPAAAICSEAARIPADVLVIGRGSAAGVFGRLRTNAYAIIRQSPCPVVSV